ncbi:uncharacterized protein LY89DRAFT_420910 [Mollisia scopiformis]|uniref:Gfd2/YDR514C-like C-terminal domain-containing protein n=1 Tax=Mollisia scopiformis TaxID=149040 RepID=A0A194XLF8_MOLSC|nr:uncharacterized protein LY89DRAFT_420910 [Mollisia scopiformis]KUJ20966.1 hypothetical protein LY89DRAFT_420910 [Mollisia scopiformis]
MTASEKSKKGAAKAKKTLDQAQRYQASRDIVKRVQTYIGIRKPDDGIEAALFKAHESRVEWYDPKAIAAAVSREATAKFGPATFFDAGKPMKFTPEDSVVFISVDVEANEFNHREITEIGVATLDTLDLVQLVPGKGGENWMKQIRARHFRINEYRHVINRVHVSGCPGSFEFGKSEFINLANAPAAIASCFKAPFSGADTTSLDQDMPKRNIVLVGHSIGADIAFLRDMGYDVTNLANLINTVDTGDMWKYVKKVMIGLAIKHVQDKGKSKVVFPTENKFGEDNLAITRTTNASGWEIDEEDAQVAAAHEALKQLPLPEDDDDDDEWGFQNPTGVPWSTEYISYLDDGAQPGGLQEPLVPSSTVATLQQEDSDDAPSTTPDLVMTEQEALDFVMNAPWGDEGALMEQLGKIRLAPSQ